MGIFKASNKPGKDFVRHLRPGDAFIMLENGAFTEDEEVDSKEKGKYLKGQKFIIQKFGDSDVRALVTNAKDSKEEGWISVETRKGLPLVGACASEEKKPTPSDGKASSVPTKMDKFAFVKTAKDGDLGETLFHVTVRKGQEMDSPILYELGVGVPFKVLERVGDQSRRCKVQLFTKNNRTGWISMETRKSEPLVGPMSKKNRVNLVDAAELVKEYEAGQTHEVKTALRVEEDEYPGESMSFFYCQPGEKVKILEMGTKSKTRAKVQLLSGKKNGWITLVQAGGDFTLGKVGSKHDAQSGMWKSSKVKNFLFAARDGNLPKLKELSEGSRLLGSAAPINATDAQGKTALIYASAFGRVDCCIYLLTRPNVEVNALDAFNRTALHHACKIGNYRIIEVLVKSNANVNARDFKGHVPLMQLAVIGDIYPDAYKCVQFLLRNNAICTVQDYCGVGPIDFASSICDAKMVEILEQGGAHTTSTAKAATTTAATTNKTNAKKKAKEAVKTMKQGDKSDRWEADSEDEGAAEAEEAAAAQGDMSPKELAQSELDKAVEGRDVMELTNAIEGALANQIDVKDAEKRLKELKEVIKAEEWMETCLEEDSPDIPKCQEALKNAKKFNVPQDTVEGWQKQIDKLLPAYEARQALEKAAKPENIATLEGEIKKATAVLSKKEIAPYQKKLDEYKNFDAAMVSLKDTFKKKDVVQLADLVKTCAVFQSKMSGDQKKLLADAEALVAVEWPKIEAEKKVQEALDRNPDSDDYISNLDKVTAEVSKLGIINDNETLKKGLKIVKAEKERVRIRSEMKKMMDESKTFSKMTDIDQLSELKDKLQKLVNQSRKVDLPELEVAPVGLRLRKIHNQVEDLKGAIRIYFRSRPLSQNEKDQGAKAALEFCGDGMTITCKDEDDKGHTFQLDNVFTPGTQEEVFHEVKDLAQSAFDGYNVTLFAYGQTGAGKTYTMYGKPDDLGVVPRTLREIFAIKDSMPQCQCTIIGSMIELYRAEFNDLLNTADPKARPPLNVRSDKKGDVYVENAIEEQAMCAKDLEGMIDKGFNNRKVAATLMNAESSRSHLIVIVKIICVNTETNETIKGKIILVDLAGSERMKKSGVQGEALKEAIEINKSLTALGDVIEQLTSGQKTIGYRNHKLTQVMQDSLGGSAKTLMFCNCSPASINCDETIMTLKWATRAKQVKNDGGAAKAKAKGKAAPKPVKR